VTGLPPAVEAVVVDCDGLLVDTETCWTRAESAIFAEQGFGFGAAEKQLLIGKSLEDGATAMAEYFGCPDQGPVVARRLHDLVARELAGGADALPGAREVVTALRGRVPIAVASNSPRVFVDAALVSAGLADLFEQVYAADDVERPKPAPDLYLAACAGLGADPACSVAFEDSRTGVASAKAAGMLVVGVPSLPGVVLDTAYSFGSLVDDGLVAWVRQVSVGCRRQATGSIG
jgi:HAD superfamily hydrolase (TIGR01509 family)